MNIKSISYDETADAAYIALGDGSVASTEEVADGILVDRDAGLRPVGIEVLSVVTRLGHRDRDSYLAGLAEGILLPVRSAAAA